ncbi:DUF4386 domain-containing protein [Streptomyces actinomycinicus]|uniref:DUF4386 domain-containing protein n=2 Tax=Streptomyces actinomycinicus TaxID=1695166 RepID=A0A937ERJ7_9ACTN|nr:DUF4386 family protein [Streptomyces actinomycinicus]MBL1087293.1 DUF4386 domain-containing protein [Streptomyces actinomycinicus]
MPARSAHTVTGALLIGGAVLVNAAFALLSGTFDYPDVLRQPTEEVLLRFHTHALLIGTLFTLLALGAATLAPIALRTARMAAGGRTSTAAATTGVAAAAVQVAGLMRWPLLVPPLAGRVADPDSSAAQRAEAVELFETLNRMLGQIVGETLGYVLTAAWTLLIVTALRRRSLISRPVAALALTCVPLILAGLLVPFGVPGADQANFAGYVLWSLWLILLGTGMLRASRIQSPVQDHEGTAARACGVPEPGRPTAS